MDPVLADLLRDVIIVLGGLATGILVAKITADRSRELERERRQLDLCGEFLRDIETLRDQGKRQVMGQPFTDWSDAQDRAHSALTQLQIIAPKLERPILDLWHAAQKIVLGAQFRTYAAGRDIPPEAHDWEALEKGYDDAHAKFLAAVRRQLG